MTTEDSEQRARGKAQMKAVYGWDIDHVEGSFVEYTVDHLFAEVWQEGKLTVKERRLMLIGMAGILVWATARRAASQPLVPVRDPLLDKCLAHKNV